MLRSQSSLNLSDERKPRSGGFLSSWRSRKSLIGEADKTTDEQVSKRGPLSASVSSMDLNSQRRIDNSHSKNYSSKVARERQGIEDKENIPVNMLLKSPMDRVSQQSSSSRTIRPRSSAPSLNRSKRNSVHLGSGTSHFSISSPRLRSVRSFNLASSNDSSSVIKEEDASVLSPSSQDTHSTTDSLMEESISPFVDSENDYVLENDGQNEISDIKLGKFRRTSNLQNINEFFKLLNPSNEKLPLVNRKSLDFEQCEIKNILKTLNEDHGYVFSMKLVENALFLTVQDQPLDTVANDSGDKSFEKELNNTDYLNVLREEPYHEIDNFSVMI
ncbi:uncharacterized protein PRCAT00004615001 [Priceomyces carsonii]|uniref:uncharacterized protein n=1 Tax=Priceomyces carsonii TaxID=28549 RepID=UPI002EDB02EB|nr:unnamed protein product [Priceomyces carsonii]